MPITPSAAEALPGLVLRTVQAPDALSPSARALFAPPGAGPLFLTLAWFECAIAAASAADATPCFVTIDGGGQTLAVIPLWLRAGGRGLESLTTPYTCLYRPLLAPDLSAPALAMLGRAFGRFCRRWPVVRLDAMPDDDPAVATFLGGAGRSTWTRAGFVNFGNWHEPVSGLAWPAYLRSRPGELRETIRRKLARAERGRSVRCEILHDPADAPRAVAIYQSVYARSWKPDEPFPAFNPALIARTAAMGLLRLGVLLVDGAPVAVQFWVVTGGVATVLKLAHDERAKAISPGTVLTAMMIRHLLDGEHVDEIDFGRGDDAYKRGWTSRRRARIGVVLINPLRPAGLAFAARHLAGRALRRLRAD